MKTFRAITMPLSVILSVCIYHPAEATARSHTGSTSQQSGPLILVRGGEHVGGGEFHESHESHEGFSGSRTRENQKQNRLENRVVHSNDDDFMRNDAAVGGLSGGGFDVGVGVGVGAGVDDGDGDGDGGGGTNTSGCYYDNQGNLVCNAN